MMSTLREFAKVRAQGLKACVGLFLAFLVLKYGMAETDQHSRYRLIVDHGFLVIPLLAVWWEWNEFRKNRK